MINSLAFLSSKTELISVSNDRMIKFWNVITENETDSFEGHTDYIKVVKISKAGNIFLTGSYDHSVKIWDLSSKNLIMTIDHGFPVENALFSSSGNMVITCGGKFIKFWDISVGGSLIYSMQPHQKTITDICFSSNEEYIVTASLDRHSKVISFSEFKIVHGFKFNSPILKIDVNDNDSSIAFGLMNGKVIAKHRKLEVVEKVSKSGMNYLNFDVSTKIKKTKFNNLEKYFKKIQFRDAIDYALKVRD